MSFALVKPALQVSLALLVLSIGLCTRAGDATFLFRHPALFARSVLSVNVIMPMFVFWVAMVFDLKPPVALALLALAISPMPPFLPLSTAKAGGEVSYTIALLAAESVLAIVLVPIATWVLGQLLATELSVPPSVIAVIVTTSVILPLALGGGIRRFFPDVANRIAGPTNIVAIVLLVVAFVPLLIAVWKPMVSLIGNGTILSVVAIAIVGLAVGHAFGGPEAKHRPVLALATASRHPAVAIAILSATFPNQKLAPAAVVLSMLTTSLVAMVYTKWTKSFVLAPSKPPLLRPGFSGRTPSRTSSAGSQPGAPMQARRRDDSHT